MECPSCGNKEATNLLYCGLLAPTCDRCGAKAKYPTDADGNRISYPAHGSPFYSYAADTVFTSKHQMADHLKKHNLIQKGK